MSKTILALAASAALFAGLGAAPPAQAEVQYPWCAEYGGRDGGGTNCGFTSYAQCQANIHGIGGTCYENPAYGAARAQAKKPAKVR